MQLNRHVIPFQIQLYVGVCRQDQKKDNDAHFYQTIYNHYLKHSFVILQ